MRFSDTIMPLLQRRTFRLRPQGRGHKRHRGREALRDIMQRNRSEHEIPDLMRFDCQARALWGRLDDCVQELDNWVTVRIVYRTSNRDDVLIRNLRARRAEISARGPAACPPRQRSSPGTSPPRRSAPRAATNRGKQWGGPKAWSQAERLNLKS